MKAFFNTVSRTLGIPDKRVKPRGFDAMGNVVALRTDRTSYIDGDTVTGGIYLSVRNPAGLPVKQAFAVLRGKCVSRWTERHRHTETTTDRDGKTRTNTYYTYHHYTGKKYFVEGFQLLYNGIEQAAVFPVDTLGYTTLPPGNYCFPFAIPIPAGSPSCAEVLGGYAYCGAEREIQRFHAKVVYKVYGDFETIGAKSEGFFRGRIDVGLYGKQQIQVYQKPDKSRDQYNLKMELEKKLYKFGCFNRGEVQCKVHFSTNAAVIGSTYVASLDINAEHLKSSVRETRLKVVQTFVLIDNYGHRVVINTYGGVKGITQGVKKKTKATREIRIPIDFERFQPSSDTPCFKVHHNLSMKAYVGQTTSDTKFKLPISVYMKSDYTIPFQDLIPHYENPAQWWGGPAAAVPPQHQGSLGQPYPQPYLPGPPPPPHQGSGGQQYPYGGAGGQPQPPPYGYAGYGPSMPSMPLEPSAPVASAPPIQFLSIPPPPSAPPMPGASAGADASTAPHWVTAPTSLYTANTTPDQNMYDSEGNLLTTLQVPKPDMSDTEL